MRQVEKRSKRRDIRSERNVEEVWQLTTDTRDNNARGESEVRLKKQNIMNN